MHSKTMALPPSLSSPNKHNTIRTSNTNTKNYSQTPIKYKRETLNDSTCELPTPQNYKLRRYYSQEDSKQRKFIHLETERIKPVTPQNYRHALKHCTFSKDQRDILNFNADLKKSRPHQQDKQKPQIKYLNTIKKIRNLEEQCRCELKLKKSGAEFKLKSEKQLTQSKSYNEHGMNILIKNHLNKNAQKVVGNSKHEGNLLSAEEQRSKLFLTRQKAEIQYKMYSIERMKNYMQREAVKQVKIPFAMKKLEEEQRKAMEERVKKERQKEEDRFAFDDGESNESNRKSKKSRQIDSPRRSRHSSLYTIKTVSLKKRLTQRETQYEIEELEDIHEFQEIIDFFHRIHQEIAKYQKSSQLSNKIDVLLNQVDNSTILTSIFDKCKEDLSYFTMKKIYKILAKYNSILSTMNYLVYIIKLNISTERKKRFHEKQKNISHYHRLIKRSTLLIAKNFKKIDNSQLKKEILNTIQNNSDLTCLGLNQKYTDFVGLVENLQSTKKVDDEVPTAKFQCELLKFEVIME